MEPRAVKLPSRGLLVETPSGARLRREMDTGEKQLNALNVENRQFSIIQDRRRSGVSVVVAEKSTGTFLSSFPAESVLRLLERVRNDHNKTCDGPTESAPLISPAPKSEMKTILVVEDDTVVRDIMCEILRANGFCVMSASGGWEALQLIRGHRDRIDLVMTDLVMPDMNGLQLVEKVREATAAFKVVFMSGYGAHRDLDFGHCDPSIPILQKPFRAAELIRQVHLVLGTHVADTSPLARP